MIVNEKKSFDKIVFKNGFDVYKDHSLIPIEVVAENLGITLTKSNSNFKCKCPCPNHDDKNPSTDIITYGKYENTFKCWSCGEHGGVLELVIAVRSGIEPSKYWSVLKDKNAPKEEKIKMIKARNDAGLFIEQFFPGNIEVIHYENGKAVNSNENELKAPSMPKEVWQDIKRWTGIDMSIFSKRMMRVDYNGQVRNIGYYEASEYEIYCMLYSKILETEDCLRDYKRLIYSDFPDLDRNAKIVISDTIDKKVEEIEVYEEKWAEFLDKFENERMMEEPLEEQLKKADFSDIEEFKGGLE